MKSIVFKLNNLFKSQFFKFLLIGGFCTLQNIFWLYFLTTILKIHYIISMIILAIIVNSLGYYLNKKYTFQKTNGNFWRGLLKYHFIMLSSFLTVLLLMYILVDILNFWYLYANIIITIGMTIYNFFLHKKLTFK
jgi:putative flippase GtrA